MPMRIRSSQRHPSRRKTVHVTNGSVASKQRINALTAQCQPGWSLPRGFYSDQEIYGLDVERIWRRGWLFAAHSCEIRAPGDFVTLEIDSDPIMVVRGHDRRVHALHNVCRHRGSIVATEAAQPVTRFICPYHQWAYDLDGKLLACRGMPEDFDKSKFGLRQVRVREVEGLIFISLAMTP